MVNSKSGACRRHGGKSLAGPASPRWKDGEHSSYRFIPTQLREHYALAERNPDLLTFREDVKLIESRLNQLMHELEAQAPGSKVWERASKAFKDFNRARAKADVNGMNDALQRMAEADQESITNRALWHDIQRLLKDRMRLIEAEQKRIKNAAQNVPVDEVFQLLDEVVSSLKRNVTNRAEMAKVVAEIRSLTSD